MRSYLRFQVEGEVSSASQSRAVYNFHRGSWGNVFWRSDPYKARDFHVLSFSLRG